MNTKLYLITAALAVTAAGAQAHQFTTIDGHESRDASVTVSRPLAGQRAQSDLARAEVLADLQLYRESGFAELDRADNPAWGSPAYQAAAERYAALRESPRHAELVQKYLGSARDGSLALSTR
jgi:hypothetical protein